VACAWRRPFGIRVAAAPTVNNLISTSLIPSQHRFERHANRVCGLTVLVAFAAAIMAHAQTSPTTYAIDTGASRVIIHVDKTGLFSFAGHTHEIAAPAAEGAITVDPDDLSRSSVRLAFDASALKVTGRGEPAGDVPDVQQTMEGPKVLDASRFPRITFTSRRIEMLGRDGTEVRLRVAGDLTLHGVTKPETAEVTVTVTHDRVIGKGTLRVKQTDFGIQPVTAGGGTVRVRDEVEVEFTIVASAS
jgi:polyisoprenoid-binding protein YceI